MKKKDNNVKEAIVEEEKPFFFPRLVAYFIDSLIVFALCFGVMFIIPKDKNHDKYVEEYSELQKQLTDKKINAKEFNERAKDVVYDVDYTNTVVTITQIAIYVGYFIVLQYYNKGRTLGKKIMKIKVVSDKEDELSINQVAGRALLCDSILINIVRVGCLLFIGRNYYYYSSMGLQYLDYAIILISLGMVIFRKDGKGIHDLLFKTKVISDK